jgi:hypothetical protein
MKTSITKLLAKPTIEKDKEREKEKKVAIYWKIISLKALVSWEGWKIPFLKECMQLDYRQ